MNDKLELVEFKDDTTNYKLMQKWCSEDYIYEWFEQRILSYDEIVTKYRGKLLSKKQHLFIVCYNGKEIGYVQLYKYDDKIVQGLKKCQNIYEFDFFIGDKNYLSKGIGTKLVHYISEFIYKNYKSDCILLRAFKRNIRALKCYQKNGFHVISEYDGFDTIGNSERMVMLIKEKSEV